MRSDRKTAPRFAGIGGRHSPRSGTVEWLTPPEIIAALGPFDLDPCAPDFQPYPTAARVLTRRDNGLISRWDGKVWLNPPYTNREIELWLGRMAEHENGIALIFARTDTDAFFRHVWERAGALLFMRGRISFIVGEAFDHAGTGRRFEVGDLAPGNAGAPTVLCAYGADNVDVLAACSIEGQFVPLRFPRHFLLSSLKAEKSTWAEEVAAFFEGREGPVELADLYRHFAAHPKGAENRNVDAKVRQQLQRGPYRRVAPGLWEAAK